jgi:hypothetical protein
MRDPNSFQNGHNRPEDHFREYAKWQDIPLSVLRDFVGELRLNYTDRGVAEMVELSVGAVQDFASGDSEPERRTRRAFGELYMAQKPISYGWETETLPRLRSVLPAGKDAALDFIDELIERAVASGADPKQAEELREWLETVVRAEYAVQSQFDYLLRKRKPKGSGDGAPKRTRRKKPDADPEDP